VPTPTDAPATPSPSCYETAENEIVIYTNDAEGEKARDTFCKENDGKDISESDAIRGYFTDTHEYIEGQKAEFQFNAYAGKDCGTKKIVEQDCKDAMNALMDKCKHPRLINNKQWNLIYAVKVQLKTTLTELLGAR
jgi:hypothetical protein